MVRAWFLFILMGCWNLAGFSASKLMLFGNEMDTLCAQNYGKGQMEYTFVASPEGGSPDYTYKWDTQGLVPFYPFDHSDPRVLAVDASLLTYYNEITTKHLTCTVTDQDMQTASYTWTLVIIPHLGKDKIFPDLPALISQDAKTLLIQPRIKGGTYLPNFNGIAAKDTMDLASLGIGYKTVYYEFSHDGCVNRTLASFMVYSEDSASTYRITTSGVNPSALPYKQKSALLLTSKGDPQFDPTDIFQNYIVRSSNGLTNAQVRTWYYETDTLYFHPKLRGSEHLDLLCIDYLGRVLKLPLDLAVAPPTYSIKGTALNHRATPVAGTVAAYVKVGNELDLVSTTAILPDGSFAFYDLPRASYVLQALPDSAGYLPTYYVKAPTWQKAYVLPLTGHTSSIDILVASPMASQGVLSLQGILRTSVSDSLLPFAIGYQPIVLYDAQRRAVAWSKTDSLGRFSFAQLPEGTYTVALEVPGVLAQHTFFLSSTQGQWQELSVERGHWREELLEKAEETATFCPHPITGTSTLPIEGEELTEITVFNTLGQTVAQHRLQAPTTFVIHRQAYAAGVYTVMLRNNNGSRKVKFAVE